jgi:tetratricopeptide (TPR) repeat protein
MAVSAIIQPTRIGDYEILATLGSGGMGVVYKALDLKLQRVVALKFLSIDPADQQRLLREARAASVLDHNNIVTVHSVEQAADGAWFLVMQYCEGRTLEDTLADGPLPPAQAADITAQVARGLAHAHAHGLIHRDIKPSNIILTAGGVAKIVDFGLAHHFDMTGSTQSATFGGTLTYMSPEQLTGRPLDARSDIWSLGIVFYRMLTGHLPFAGSSPAEQVWAAVHTMPRAMTGIPEPLQLIALRALAKLPGQRYATCQELLGDLARLQIERRHVDAPPDPALPAELQHASKSAGAPSRRHYGRVLLVSLILFVFALFVLPTLQVAPPAAALRPINTTADAAHKALSDAIFQEAARYESIASPRAADLYLYAADLAPADWMGYHKLAAYYFRQREYKLAVSVWQHVVLLNPKNPNAYSNIAIALLQLGRLDEAIAQLRVALDLGPDYGVYSNLGMIYYQQKRWAESADAYEKALKMKGTDYRVWGNLGLAFEWLKQSPSAAAAYRQELALLDAAAVAEPGDPLLQSKLGLAYSRQKRATQAIAATQRALARAPNDPSVLSNAGETYENLGDRARALDFVTRSLDHGKTLDQLDHNPGLRRLLADPGFRAKLARHTANLAAPRRQ